MPELTFRSVPAREALADPDRVLFECSLRLAEFRAAEGGALVDRRTDNGRTVTDYRGGKLTFQHDDGRTSHAAVTDGLLAKLAAAPFRGGAGRPKSPTTEARAAAARARAAPAAAKPRPKP
jgi:hypothetical protein